MSEKYIVTKDYDWRGGRIPIGSEIVYFRGQIWFNGMPILQAYRDVFIDLINNDEYVRKVKVEKNTF